MGRRVLKTVRVARMGERVSACRAPATRSRVPGGRLPITMVEAALAWFSHLGFRAIASVLLGPCLDVVSCVIAPS